jgi:glycosyltransferase involved in cell wall biosynthesis
MRILYCNKYNFPFSGTEAYLFDVMELMRSRHHDVALFSMADPRGEPTPYDQHFVNLIDFKSQAVGLLARARKAAHALYSTEARKKLREMIADFRPDVAHVRNIYHHLSPSIFWELRAQKVPILYHLNDFKLICPSYNMVSRGVACEKCHGGKFLNVVTEGCYNGPVGSAWVLAAEAYAHKWLRTYEKCVDRFLAPSQFVKDKLTENGWDANRIDVLQHFQRIPNQTPFNFGSDAPILYFGRLSAEKGIADLVRAMQRVPEIRLFVSGDGPQRSELEQLARDLRLTNVSFTGHLAGATLDKLIAAARFTVLPSRAYETMGKSILESFASSRAVVATDLGSRRELIRDGQTGLLFRAGDIDQLAKVISRLYDAPEVAARMGSEAREFVRTNHSEERHYVKLIGIYRELAQISLVPRTTPPLRVAFIGGRGVVSKYSGIETYYEEVGKQLSQLGHEVTAYCRTYFTPAMPNHNGIRLIRLPTVRTKHLETLLHTFLCTVHAMWGDAEIVHYHALGPALFSFLPRLVGKKTVVTIQGLDWKRAKWGWIASSVLRMGEHAAVRFPNATMVVSHTLESRFRPRFPEKISYVPNGTSIRKRCASGHLKGWGLESREYILFLGRLSPEKNCHLLIEAYEKLKTPIKLVLAGGSSYSASYAATLRQHETDQIRILDWVTGDALDELLTNACLFVLPSHLEGLSLALLDAMGAGMCVLASDIPENRELVDGAGYTFKTGNVLDLEKMLRLLVGSPELRDSAAKKALERIRRDYLWPKITKQIEQVYLDLMGRTVRPDLKKATSAVVPATVTEDGRIA